MPSRPTSDEEAKRILSEWSPEQLGNFGEAIWSRSIANSKWRYFSLTKICEGGAPMARGNNSPLILPDFDACKDGRSVFVEAKAKTTSVVYWNKKQARHGINQKNYEHYREIERQCGRPCCIGIVELWDEQLDRSSKWSGSLLFEKLGNLGDPRSENPEVPPKVYWPQKSFCNLDSFSPMELFALAHGDLCRSYEYELDRILFPHKQTEMF